jgi:hypothetical protein
MTRLLHRGIRDKLRRFGWHHPEWWVVVASGAAWAFMIYFGFPHLSHTRTTMDGGHEQGMLGIIVMVVSMMLPLTVANVRHVALSSLWPRRHRAIALFLAGYLAVWIVVQTVITSSWILIAPLIGWKSAAIAATINAALWEVTATKRQRLRRCHRTVPLAPRGWRADADCAQYGVTTGLSCVSICWALMVASAAFAHSILVMTVLFGVQLSGRYRTRPSPAVAALVVVVGCLLPAAVGFMGHQTSTVTPSPHFHISFIYGFTRSSVLDVLSGGPVTATNL